MMRRLIIPILTILAGFTVPALAQETGGLALSPRMARGPTGIAQPLPFVPPGITAADVQASLKATDRSALHQSMIARLRGDAGYLGGFSFGQPLSLSVQPWQRFAGTTDPGLGVLGNGGDAGAFWGPDDGSGNGSGYVRHYGRRPRQVIVNEFDTFQGPVVIGNNNNVQQQTATGSGPIALQQVLNQSGASGTGATNVISPDGNIVQQAPGTAHPRRNHGVAQR
jgi:hypothetical protein